MSEKVTIGEFAKRFHVSVETVRFYHRKGLLPLPTEKVGAFRVYGPHERMVFQFILMGKKSGFTLEEIKALMDLEPRAGKRFLRQLIARKMDEINATIAGLLAQGEALRGLLEGCRQDGSDELASTMDILIQAAEG
ncbi:MerR family transcriptional regulator [Sulfidibacter corallicola]|uniref:MerR family transcriptional regulator n=1 Tax=Sulfidibacter corallicola TaxID=2818388 RepID=A0A8A4TFJ4_SULCO|nr:MerR family transcriptional regulator [Sulfidibacter corallicola]QTD48716.1 MerR family transcriptional regulator [Sulfidibacter corallicola]